MKKYISRFHYITQDMSGRSHIEQADMACQAGANWIQYRCLTKPDDELVQEIHQIAAVCDDWGATLILTDHYHLLDKVDAQGVLMEDFNVNFDEIRSAISDEKTLGASASNIEQLMRIQNASVVDYAAYGPFAHSDNRFSNNTLLGHNGYRELQEYEIDIPVIALAGIQLGDVEDLIATGVYGIAVSSAINSASDPKSALKEFYQMLY
jgi:thiamine-phosphate pyrophosphorylase